MNDRNIKKLAIVEIVSFVIAVLLGILWGITDLDFEPWFALAGLVGIGAEISRNHANLPSGWWRGLLGDIGLDLEAKGRNLYARAAHESCPKVSYKLFLAAQNKFARGKNSENAALCSLEIGRIERIEGRKADAAATFQQAIQSLPSGVGGVLRCTLMSECGETELFANHETARNWYEQAANCFESEGESVEALKAKEMLDVLEKFPSARDIFKAVGLKYPEDA